MAELSSLAVILVNDYATAYLGLILLYRWVFSGMNGGVFVLKKIVCISVLLSLKECVYFYFITYFHLLIFYLQFYSMYCNTHQCTGILSNEANCKKGPRGSNFASNEEINLTKSDWRSSFFYLNDKWWHNKFDKYNSVLRNNALNPLDFLIYILNPCWANRYIYFVLVTLFTLKL